MVFKNEPTPTKKRVDFNLVVTEICKLPTTSKKEHNSSILKLIYNEKKPGKTIYNFLFYSYRLPFILNCWQFEFILLIIQMISTICSAYRSYRNASCYRIFSQSQYKISRVNCRPSITKAFHLSYYLITATAKYSYLYKSTQQLMIK